MALTVNNFIKLANFYNQMSMMMSAVCVQKGGIPQENYVGRFFLADTLEFVTEYGRRLMKSQNVSPEVAGVISRFEQQYEVLKDFCTPSQKPVYEMTLEEFERIMNIE